MENNNLNSQNGIEIQVKPQEIEVKPHSMKEICDLYKMGYKAMNSCLYPILHKLGPKRGRMFTVKQVEMIFNFMGLPYTLKQS